MSDINPVLKEFLWTMERSISDTVRVADDTSVIKDQCTGVQEGDKEFLDPRDNDIYNIGVKDGVAGFADSLHTAGYVITDKEGSVVSPGEQIDTAPAPTFSQTFFTTNWASVNN